MSFTYKHPMAALTVDVVVLADDDDGGSRVLLVERGKEPFKGKYALPGGHFDVEKDESIEDAALRELEEETGLKLPVYPAMIGLFAQKGRDPRGRYVSVAFASLLKRELPVVGGDDAARAAWVPIKALLPTDLAFDHYAILVRALGWASRVRESFLRWIER